MHAITMEKVGVNFDLLYVNNKGEVVKTMKQVAKNGVIAELLVYPDSVSVAGEKTFAKNRKIDECRKHLIFLMKIPAWKGEILAMAH